MLSNPTLIVAAYYTKFHSALPRKLPRKPPPKLPREIWYNTAMIDLTKLRGEYAMLSYLVTCAGQTRKLLRRKGVYHISAG